MRFTIEQLLGRYLSLRPRSEQEVRRYLEQKSRKYTMDLGEQEKLITKYKDFGYINDEKFAESMSHSAVANKSKGKRFVQMKLHQAGLEPELILEAIASIDPEDIKRAMEKRLARYERKWVALDTRVRRMKAYHILLQSGFSSSEIRPFLDEWGKTE